MPDIDILAIDLGKYSFQVCATKADGDVVYNRKYSRRKLSELLAKQSPCVVAMEACATSHNWSREAKRYGHDVKLIPPIYVKPFVKRSKNDATDAAAIATAVRQPDMRFVQVKSRDQQSHAMLFKSHQTLTRQRSQLIITLRGHLAEYGVIVPKGNLAFLEFEKRLEEDPDQVPTLVLETARLYYSHIEQLTQSIVALERQMASVAKLNENTRRLRTIPGIGPINAIAFLAFAPPMESFKRGRDFSAWLGLVPRQHSTGGKTKLGRVSKMGQSDLRRLLICGATACIRWAKAKGIEAESWLGNLISRKPAKMVAVALANKMARIMWAMIIKERDYEGGLVRYVKTP